MGTMGKILRFLPGQMFHSSNQSSTLFTLNESRIRSCFPEIVREGVGGLFMFQDEL